MASTLGLKSTLAGDGAQEPVVGKTMHPSFAGRGKMSEMQARAMAAKFVGRSGVPNSDIEGSMPPIVIDDSKPAKARPNPSLDSQLENVFAPSNDYSDVRGKAKDQSLIPPTYPTEEIIGGQDLNERERYQTVTRASLNGQNVADKKRSHGLKKVEGKSGNGPDIISPITNLKLADYGTWEMDKKVEELHKRREAELEKAIAEEEERRLGDDPVMRKLKLTLASRGAKGLAGLARRFKLSDKDHSGSLDSVEFKIAMRETKMGITDDETIALFKTLDTDGSGEIAYNEFLRTLAGNLSVRRKKLVNMAFDVLDKDGNGVIELADIAAAYNVTKHPQFLSGQRSKEDILLEFLSGFEVGGDKDSKVTREEFENYYSGLSASIDSDNYFELMIRNAWHITGGEGVAANSANLRILVTHSDGTQEVVTLLNDLGVEQGDKREIMRRLRDQGVDVMAIPGFTDKQGSAAALKAAAETSAIDVELGGLGAPHAGNKGGPGGRRFKSSVPPGMAKTGVADQLRDEVRKQRKGGLSAEGQTLLEKLREALKQRGAHGFCGLQRSFRIMDVDGSRSLDRAEFRNAMESINVLLTSTQLEEIFQYFDKDNSNSIEYDEFLSGLRGTLSGRRMKLVMQAFEVLDRDGSGVVDATDVALIYDASEHPAVLSGAKTKDAVLREFLDTFDVGGEVDGKVTRDEFVNYYTNISASIDNEDYFELMIRNAWHIEGGEGAAANSANRRVLVTRADGSQGVEVIKRDLGLKADDKEGMVARLRAQGVSAQSVELYGGMDDTKDAKKPRPPTLGKPGSSSPQRLSKQAGVKGTRYNVPAASRTGDATTQISMSAPPQGDQGAAPPRAPAPKVNPYDRIVAQIKDLMKKRGSGGLIGLQRKFRAMDKDGSKSLSKMEFKNSLLDLGLGISDGEIYGLFDYFDMDRSGTVDFEEFLQALRDPLGMKRLQLIHMAFNVIDKDGNGIVDAAEVAQTYDASKHPAVVTGAKTKDAVLREFLDTFDVGGEVDGKVTRDEFVNYYTNISASIDNEDYFELMIRNAWHIEGGEGAAANSANRRVLVTRADGSQGVEVIKRDLGLKADDKEGMVARLRAQGVSAQSVELYGGVEMEDTREEQEKLIPKEVEPVVAEIKKEALGKFNNGDFEGAMASFESLLATLQSYLTVAEGLPEHPEVVKAQKSIKLAEKKLQAQRRASTSRRR